MLKVFVGTDPQCGLSDRVLENGIRKHASTDLEITWMRAGDPGFEVGESADGSTWNIGRPAGQWFSGRGWRTDFSWFRFAVPELAGKSGRALYLETDMIVLDDLAKLWDLPQTKPVMGSGGRYDILMFDCQAVAEVSWWPDLQRMKRDGLDLGFYHPQLDADGLVDLFGIPEEWKDRKSTRLNSSHSQQSRMPSSA